jgi:hypothetical protein
MGATGTRVTGVEEKFVLEEFKLCSTSLMLFANPLMPCFPSSPTPYSQHGSRGAGAFKVLSQAWERDLGRGTISVKKYFATAFTAFYPTHNPSMTYCRIKRSQDFSALFPSL